MVVNDQLIAALDVGTTTVRCIIFDKNGNVKGQSKDKVLLYYSDNGKVEIRYNELWQSCVNVIKNAVQDSKSELKAIKGLGISCQRNSFITWKKSTNQPYHNIITWKDLRADDIVNEINYSIKLKVLNFVSKILYSVTWSKRFLAGSILKMTNNQITPRLIWVLRNIPEISEDLKNDDVAFGTIDTWLLHKFSNGLLHVTDVSNASSTGLFDPFTLSWADWAFKMFNIPKQIFPEVVDNAGPHFGQVSETIFGEPINICCCMADQSASMFGSLCFKKGDFKITMGTGTFLNVNTGNKPHASFYGLYPLVGWKFGGDLTYIAEGSSNDTGNLVQFAQDLDLIENPSDCSKVANSVKDSDGVYFIPAFNGLQAPLDDPKASAGFIGLKPTTTKNHLLRAILESIVFRIIQQFVIFRNETHLNPEYIRVDGGVSNCDFIVQTIVNIINIPAHRPKLTEMSAMGVALMAGLNAGIWESTEELVKMKRISQEFSPSSEEHGYEEKYDAWCKALPRFSDWYS